MPEYFLDEMSQDEIEALVNFKTGKKSKSKILTKEEVEAKVKKRNERY